MNRAKIASGLTMFALVSAGAAAHAGSSKQVLAKASDGSVDLRKSDLCVSEDGRTFARKSGQTCRAGDLVYINQAFDSDKAGNLAEKFCDDQKEPPPESMDVYGVLCYSRVSPPFRVKSAVTAK